MLHEGLLQRMHLAVLGETLDRADALAVRLNGEHQAGARRHIVHQHGAGTADAMLAADMGAGLAAILADGIGERAPRLDIDGCNPDR